MPGAGAGDDCGPSFPLGVGAGAGAGAGVGVGVGVGVGAGVAAGGGVAAGVGGVGVEDVVPGPGGLERDGGAAPALGPPVAGVPSKATELPEAWRPELEASAGPGLLAGGT